MTDGTLPNGWRGVLALFDNPAVDGTVIPTPDGDLMTGPKPWPLSYGPEEGDLAGFMDDVWGEAGKLMAQGSIDLDQPGGVALATELRDRGSAPAGVARSMLAEVEAPDSDPELSKPSWAIVGAGVHHNYLLQFPEARIEPVYGYASDTSKD